MAHAAAAARLLLEYERYQRCGALAVAPVVIAEGFGHPALLQPQLAPQGGKRDQHRQHTAPLAAYDRGSDQGEQQAGVDRVAQVRVWAAADQLVLLLHRYRFAPVTPQEDSSPDAERQSQRHQRRATPVGGVAPGQEAL